MNKVEVLTQARALIEKPENWIKGAYFYDPEDSEVDFVSAKCFCTLGAVGATLVEDPRLYIMDKEIMRLLARAVQAPGASDTDESTVIAFNDDPFTTHEDVLGMFDRAIELAKEESNAN